jgi:teichuronic acid biosynthesis glycosyltransferase TuaC
MTRRLRVVSVCRSIPTPTEPSAGVFVLNRIAALAEHADVTIVQPVPYLPGVRPLPSWARTPGRRVAGVDVIHAPMLYVPGVLKSLDGHWLARAIDGPVRELDARSRIDLLDAHFAHPDGVGAVAVGARLGRPVFITLRGYEEDRIHERFVGAQLIDAMQRAAGCVAVSHSLKSLAVRHGVADAHVRVIQNAIDGERFSPGDRLAARARLGLDPNLRLVVSVGRLVELKRHHVLVDAMAQLRRDAGDVRLTIVGGPSYEADYPARLRGTIERHGLGDAVTLAGERPPAEIADWLRAADAFALLSSREGCCNAVLEALATGLPMVVTPAGDNPEFVRPGENGALVPIDDVAATAAALRDVLARTDWPRERIAADLRSRVGSWSTVAARVAAFFRERLETC